MLSIKNSNIEELVGYKSATTEWFTIDQDRIDSFADCTLDHQFIHTDPEKAANTPFKGTIAHGMLTLSLIGHFAKSFAVEIEDTEMVLNYGFDRVRLLTPVRCGSEVRASAVVKSVNQKHPNQYLICYEVTIEISGEKNPALVAEWLLMVITKA